MYYVYILRSTVTGKIYKGFTKDLKRRFEEHNRGDTTALNQESHGF